MYRVHKLKHLTTIIDKFLNLKINSKMGDGFKIIFNKALTNKTVEIKEKEKEVRNEMVNLRN